MKASVTASHWRASAPLILGMRWLTPMMPSNSGSPCRDAVVIPPAKGREKDTAVARKGSPHDQGKLWTLGGFLRRACVLCVSATLGDCRRSANKSNADRVCAPYQ